MTDAITLPYIDIAPISGGGPAAAPCTKFAPESVHSADALSVHVWVVVPVPGPVLPAPFTFPSVTFHRDVCVGADQVLGKRLDVASMVKSPFVLVMTTLGAA